MKNFMNQDSIRNFCIIAHIDHGKSTLADRFLELTHTVEARQMREQYLDQMDLERERGITIKLQPVRMAYGISHIAGGYNMQLAISDKQNSEYILNLIDTPGHVDFSYEVSRSLAAVEGAILLVDATKGIQAQTLANLEHAKAQNLDIIAVVNKIDLPNAQVSETQKELAKLLKIPQDKILAVSAKTGEGVAAILNKVVESVKPPQGEPADPLRALVFDSVYDSYRGVVAHVRVVDGSIKTGENIRLMATKVDDQALEVGYFTPKMKASQELKIGDIGYIVTGLKDVSQCRVGDTITKSKIKNQKSKINSLPGYKEPQAMVYASVYTTDGEVNKLREAIAKLKLNDAALKYEPENSMAFGFGFRCGFLGLLHMEIFKERLEREYNLSLIITTPQVAYRQKQTGGKIEYEEPWINLQIVTPQQYIGKIMDYLQNERGLYKSTNYLGDPSTELGLGHVLLEYQAPMSSIVVNFYDILKSISSGYASMNYEFIGYRAGDLVKMDIIIAGEKIDVLSQIVHKSQLNHQAHAITKRLKELIPRQMFEVSIQAAVGTSSTGSGQGKILAREDIPAMKKDVTGYLYGGDITRKKKLWAKQARGKKKMKKLGRVDIPTDVFIKLLRN